KTLKEIKYHYRYSSEWVIRLGDGTEISHQFVQDALNDLWRYTGEMFQPASYEKELIESGYSLNLNSIHPEWNSKVEITLNQAGLETPKNEVMQTGGKEGHHTEQMGFILTELQFMQRTYPEMKW
ncbi:MAG: Phenylacetic acid catabolic protein, partial [Saprospiraceae bacterium]